MAKSKKSTGTVAKTVTKVVKNVATAAKKAVGVKPSKNGKKK